MKSRYSQEPLSQDVPSKAAIGGHPIHPMLVPFPLASLVGTFITDMIYTRTGEPFFAQASQSLLVVGVVTGAVAAVVGLVDFTGVRKAREHTAGWIHAMGNATVLILSIINLLMRLGDVAGPIAPWGVLLSGVVAVLLAISGWFGGELSYRYRVGVNSAGSGEAVYVDDLMEEHEEILIS